mgnify:CR=1 FL=1
MIEIQRPVVVSTLLCTYTLAADDLNQTPVDTCNYHSMTDNPSSSLVKCTIFPNRLLPIKML